VLSECCKSIKTNNKLKEEMMNTIKKEEEGYILN
jgi:hypothetical protein